MDQEAEHQEEYRASSISRMSSNRSTGQARGAFNAMDVVYGAMLHAAEAGHAFSVHVIINDLWEAMDQWQAFGIRRPIEGSGNVMAIINIEGQAIAEL